MKLSEGRTACGVVFAAAMAAYLLTLCPTIYSGDSGDLTTASYTLGIAHPTGYPLYMLVGKAFSLLPVGTVAYRYNLMSAVFAALTAALIALSARALTKSWIAATGCGLLVAYSASVWAEATVADVRTMNGFFSALLLWLALRWAEKKTQKEMMMFAAACGLALTHHMSSLLYMPAFAYLLAQGGRKPIARLDYTGVLAAFFAPLSLYIYLPLRARANPAYDWGDPSTFDRFLNHITGYVHRQAVVFTLTSAEFFSRFWGIAYHYARQFSLPGVLVVWGLYRHGGKNRVFLNFTGLMVAADVVYTMFLNDVPLEITTFCIPSIAILAVWAGFGFMDIFAWVKKETTDNRWQYATVAAAALIVLSANFYESDKSQNLVAYDYAMNVLKTVDRNAVIIADGDNVVFPLSYLLIVENARPDVQLVERTGILSHQVYGMDYFYMSPQSHMDRQREVEYGLVKSGRPVYYASAPDMVFPGYTFVQTGLLYRAVGDGETLPERDYWDRYTIRQIRNATIYRDYMTSNIATFYYLRLAEEYSKTDKDRAISLLREAAEVVPDNMGIRYQAGTLLLGKGEYASAAEEFRKAILIDPKSPKAHNNLGTALNKLGRMEEATTEYRIAVALNPYYLIARNNLAVMLVNQSRYAEAADEYKNIIKIDPTFSRAYFDLGRIYYTASKPREAALLWRRYLELEPGDPRAADIMGKIAELENAAGGPTAGVVQNGTAD